MTLTKQVVVQYAKAVYETLREAGADGAAESTIYLALQAGAQLNLSEYQTLLGILESTKLVRRAHHRLYAQPIPA